MKHPLPALVFVLFLSSCASYQYFTLDSSEVPKNNHQEFAWENDTLRITYNFNGRNGPMRVNIYNKTQQPLFVNWQKSALIRDQHSVSLYNPNVQTSGSFAGASYGGVNAHVVSGGFNASFNLPEGTDFIPPAAGIDKYLVPVVACGNLFEPIPDSVESIKIADEYGNQIGKVKRQRFDKTGSPIQFSSYITFAIGSNGTHEFAITNSFFVGQIAQTTIEPANYVEYGPRGDQLYIKH
jgi:hypothetical protein